LTVNFDSICVFLQSETLFQLMQAADKTEDFLFKVLVIGDIGTGKTALIKRYVHNFFTNHYRATIGVDFALKVVNWDDNTIIRLQLWDIAGQERFGNMTRVYYKEASGALVVFDRTRKATFDAVAKWKTDLDQKLRLADGGPIPAVLMANKCDLSKQCDYKIEHATLDEVCNHLGFTEWFDTSAKENVGVDDAVNCLLKKMLAIKRANKYESLSARMSIENGHHKMNGTVSLQRIDKTKPTKLKSCC